MRKEKRGIIDYLDNLCSRCVCPQREITPRPATGALVQVYINPANQQRDSSCMLESLALKSCFGIWWRPALPRIRNFVMYSIL